MRVASVTCDWAALQELALELSGLRGARVDRVDLDERRLVLVLRHRETFGLAFDTRQEIAPVYREAVGGRRGGGAPPAEQLLRRHLEGARLKGARSPFGERLLQVCLEGRDRFGDPRNLYLVAEFFGTHPDLLLVAEGHVVWALYARRRDPGSPYTLPGPRLLPPSRRLPAYRLPPDEIMRLAAAGRFSPVLVERDGQPLQALPFAPREGEGKELPDLLHGLSLVAAHEIRRRREHDLRQSLSRALAQRIATRETALARKEEEYLETHGAEDLRLDGESLKAGLHLVGAGQGEALLPDVAEPDRLRRVTLDPQLAPSENMALIFRRYRKLKSRQSYLGGDLERLREELGELERLREEVARAEGLQALEDLRPAIVATREGSRQGKDQGPLRFRTAGGHEVLVGRSAKENDQLTRSARPSDLWFHTKDRQGAHCILRPLPGRAVGAPDRLEAALLAAYYSKQRRSSQVPVDYTFVRHVRRPRGAAPGFVLYDHHETLFVTPSDEAIARIRDR